MGRLSQAGGNPRNVSGPSQRFNQMIDPDFTTMVYMYFSRSFNGIAINHEKLSRARLSTAYNAQNFNFQQSPTSSTALCPSYSSHIIRSQERLYLA